MELNRSVIPVPRNDKNAEISAHSDSLPEQHSVALTEQAASDAAPSGGT